MADFMQALPAIATVVQAGGSIAQGVGADRAARFQAQQLEYNAGQSRASAQREAAEQRRQARLANSRLQALAGGGGSDATVVRLAQDITGEGELRALTALYEGEERAIGMETAAAARRFEGKQARTAGLMKAGNTIITAAPSLLDKYGKGGPQYNYNDDASGSLYSATGSAVRGRR